MSSPKAVRAAQRQRQKRVKSLSVVGVGVLLLILVGIWIYKAAQPGPKAAIEVAGSPSLKVNQDDVDLGYVKLGKTVDVSFTLTNVGDQPLKLSEAPYIEVVQGC